MPYGFAGVTRSYRPASGLRTEDGAGVRVYGGIHSLDVTPAGSLAGQVGDYIVDSLPLPVSDNGGRRYSGAGIRGRRLPGRPGGAKRPGFGGHAITKKIGPVKLLVASAGTGALDLF